MIFTWQFLAHYNIRKSANRNTHILVHRDTEHGVHREVVSVVDNYALHTYSSRTRYFIGGDPMEYGSEEELAAALTFHTYQ